MRNQMFHVFRNSPLGRVNLMQAAWFCERQFGMSLAIRLPQRLNFLMRFPTGEVTGTLDDSYVRFPETAADHVKEILADFKVGFSFFEPKEYAQVNLPEIPVEWEIMSCPRSISEKSNRVGLGHIGPKVRGIAKHASFPVFVPAMAFVPWKRVTIFFGGSPLATVAAREGITLARLARVPFTLITQLNGTTRKECTRALRDAGMLDEIQAADGNWQVFEKGTLEENLYAVPHDSLVVVGAAGHRLMSELLFGSKLETIQSNLPNPIVVVGPHCRVRATESSLPSD